MDSIPHNNQVLEVRYEHRLKQYNWPLRSILQLRGDDVMHIWDHLDEEGEGHSCHVIGLDGAQSLLQLHQRFMMVHGTLHWQAYQWEGK